MVGKLITLPLRVGVRATQLSLRATAGVAGLAYDVARQLLGPGRTPPEKPRTPAQSSLMTPRPAPRSRPSRPSSRARTGELGAAADLQAGGRRTSHVSEEPELVHELAEAGAEEGAGAEVTVAEPWEGYAECKAPEVVERLARATAAELAAVQLYESNHAARQTILAAVEQELRRANGSGSPTQERNR